MDDDGFIPDPGQEDDGFIPDPPQMQGKIEHPGNFLERAIKNSGTIANDAYSSLYNFTNTASFGAVDAARNLDNKMLHRDRQAPHAESGLGKVAEFGSGIAGFMAGGPGKLAEKAGAMVLPEIAAKRTMQGFMARSAARGVEGAVGGASLPGSLQERGKSAKVGAGLGVALGGISDLIFGRQAGLARKKEVGQALGGLKEQLAQRGAETDPLVLSSYLDDILNSNKFERGVSKTGIRAIKNTIDGIANEGRNLTAEELMQVEEQLGRVGIYQNPLTGYPMKDISAPGINQGAKEARHVVSSEVEDLAGGAGIGNFGSTSREYSDLAKRFPDKKPGGISNALKIGLATLGLGKGTQTAAAMTLTDAIYENPKIKRGIYDLITSGLGKTVGRVGISYGASGLSKKG